MAEQCGSHPHPSGISHGQMKDDAVAGIDTRAAMSQPGQRTTLPRPSRVNTIQPHTCSGARAHVPMSSVRTSGRES